LAGDRTLYAYQGGIDPQRLRESPGRIIMTATIKRAIERGFTEIDFLRGDEPYKATWRATPDAMRHVRVVPPTAANRVRHKLWVASDHMKHWLKRSPVAS
jgi:CelD/BcsL family acetyltransferase involved in cellulose biosynthesis